MADAEASSGSPDERHAKVVDALGLLEPERRGSALLTVVAASALTWSEDGAADALARAANLVGSDTDTIATMAGAVLGAVTEVDPPTELLDGPLIRSEADRMVALAGSAERPGHRYPDLLRWSPPRTQADALLRDEDGLYVAGLGPIIRTIDEPVAAAQGPFVWRWAELALGQTVFIKSRHDVPTVHREKPRIREAEGVGPDHNEALSMTASQARPRVDRPKEPTPRSGFVPGESGSRTTPLQRTTSSARPLDLAGAILYVVRQGLDDRAIGYTVRRVTREGTPEQVAAFLAELLSLLKK